MYYVAGGTLANQVPFANQCFIFTFQIFLPSVILFVTVNIPHYVFSHVRQTVYGVPYTLDQIWAYCIPNNMIVCY